MSGSEQQWEAQQWEAEAEQRAADITGLFTRIRMGDTFIFLFVLLLATFVVSVVANELMSGRIISSVLSGAAPLVAFLAAKAPRKWIILASVAFVLTVIVTGFGVWLDSAFARGVVSLLHVVLLFWSIPIVLRRLFAHEQVTFETVAGSLCVYLLIGLAFANLYLALSRGVADAFVIAATFQQDLPVDRGDIFYFSFVSMLTIGFGDFVPTSEWAKALTVLQAILGQVVLLTLVARMVSAAKPGRRWIKALEGSAGGVAGDVDGDDSGAAADGGPSNADGSGGPSTDASEGGGVAGVGDPHGRDPGGVNGPG